MGLYMCLLEQGACKNLIHGPARSGGEAGMEETDLVCYVYPKAENRNTWGCLLACLISCLIDWLIIDYMSHWGIQGDQNLISVNRMQTNL